MAALVDDDDAVGVAIERDADIGAEFAHLARQSFGRRRADILVDVEAVRIDADRDHLRAKLPQRFRGHLVGRAIGAIDDDAQAFDREMARQGPLGELDVARMHALDALGAADGRRLGEAAAQIAVDQRLDLALDRIRQLVPIGAEQLDAVILVRIVRGRDHHAKIGAHGAGEHGDGRRRHRAEQQHVDAHGGEARLQRRLDHVARQPRILADHNAMAMLAIAEGEARRLPDLERELGRDRLVGHAAHPIGAEILPRHV